MGREETFTITHDETGLEFDVDYEFDIDVDNNYGADADGNRGTRMESIEEVAIVGIRDVEGRDVTKMIELEDPAFYKEIETQADKEAEEFLGQ